MLSSSSSRGGTRPAPKLLLSSLLSKPTWAGEGKRYGSSTTATRTAAGATGTTSKNNSGSSNNYALQYGKYNCLLHINKIIKYVEIRNPHVVVTRDGQSRAR
jgi:hypothetical protein